LRHKRLVGRFLNERERIPESWAGRLPTSDTKACAGGWASRHHGITASRHHGITASRHHGITASRHHGITASRHVSFDNKRFLQL
jgi:hypothetical protein